jgi:hypothetical protein
MMRALRGMWRVLTQEEDLLAALRANDAVQKWVDENGDDIPEDFLSLLGRLDFAMGRLL